MNRPRTLQAAIAMALTLAISTASPAAPISEIGTTPSAQGACLAETDSTALLEGLTNRLADHDAIGWIAKISIRREALEIRDEVMQARDARREAPAGLRHRFDALFDRVTRLVRVEDVAFAAEIDAARNPVWTSLATPGAGCEMVSGDGGRSNAG